MEKELYRSRSNRMLFSVCGGLGEYIGIDPTIVRLIVVFSGVGIGLYFVAALIIPDEPQAY